MSREQKQDDELTAGELAGRNAGAVVGGHVASYWRRLNERQDGQNSSGNGCGEHCESEICGLV